MGGNPYPSVPVEKLFDLLRGGHRMPKPPYSTLEMHSIMLETWNAGPGKRPSFSELVQDLDKILSVTADEVRFIITSS